MIIITCPCNVDYTYDIATGSNRNEMGDLPAHVMSLYLNHLVCGSRPVCYLTQNLFIDARLEQVQRERY